MTENKRWMVLSVFAYLQMVPDTLPTTIDPKEVDSVHWVPLSFFMDIVSTGKSFPEDPWKQVVYPLSLYFPTRSAILPKVLDAALGSVVYFGLLLPSASSNSRGSAKTIKLKHLERPPKPQSSPSSQSEAATYVQPFIRLDSSTTTTFPETVILWGMTLNMTSDIIDLCFPSLPTHSLMTMSRPRLSHVDSEFWSSVLESFVERFGSYFGIQPEDNEHDIVGKRNRNHAVVTSESWDGARDKRVTRLPHFALIRSGVLLAFAVRCFVGMGIVWGLRKVKFQFKPKL